MCTTKAGEEQGATKVQTCPKAFSIFQARELLLSHARQNRPPVQEGLFGVRPEQCCSGTPSFRRPVPPYALPGNGRMSPEAPKSNKWKVVRAFSINRCGKGSFFILAPA